MPCATATQADLKGHAIDAAQASPSHLGDGNAILVAGEQCRIEADLAELVDQHRPTLGFRALSHQLANQAGLASPQGAGNDMGGNVLQHAITSGWRCPHYAP